MTMRMPITMMMTMGEGESNYNGGTSCHITQGPQCALLYMMMIKINDEQDQDYACMPCTYATLDQGQNVNFLVSVVRLTMMIQTNKMMTMAMMTRTRKVKMTMMVSMMNPIMEPGRFLFSYLDLIGLAGIISPINTQP